MSSSGVRRTSAALWATLALTSLGAACASSCSTNGCGTGGADDRTAAVRRSPLPIVVSRDSLESEDPYDVIMSNVSFVNALFNEGLQHDEISDEALQSYYVDYYLAQVMNGGFSQFVFNSEWNPEIVDRVRRGLRSMNATRHAELFERSAQLVDELGPDGFERFLDSEYFGDNSDRDALGAHDETFYQLNEGEEDLVALNVRWVRSRPNLRVLSIEEMETEVARLAGTFTNHDEQAAAARANELRPTQLIRRLCYESEQTLERITLVDPNHRYLGRSVVAWHFITDRGRRYMIEVDGQAMMFDDAGRRIATIDAPPEE